MGKEGNSNPNIAADIAEDVGPERSALPEEYGKAAADAAKRELEGKQRILEGVPGFQELMALVREYIQRRQTSNDRSFGGYDTSFHEVVNDKGVVIKKYSISLYKEAIKWVEAAGGDLDSLNSSDRTNTAKVTARQNRNIAAVRIIADKLAKDLGSEKAKEVIANARRELGLPKEISLIETAKNSAIAVADGARSRPKTALASITAALTLFFAATAIPGSKNPSEYSANEKEASGTAVEVIRPDAGTPVESPSPASPAQKLNPAPPEATKKPAKKVKETRVHRQQLHGSKSNSEPKSGNGFTKDKGKKKKTKGLTPR